MYTYVFHVSISTYSSVPTVSAFVCFGSTYGTNGFVLWTLGSFIFAFPSASFAVNSSFNSLPCACQSYFLTALSLSLSPAVHPSFCLFSLTLSLPPSVLLPSSICLIRFVFTRVVWNVVLVLPSPPSHWHPPFSRDLSSQASLRCFLSHPSQTFCLALCPKQTLYLKNCSRDQSLLKLWHVHAPPPCSLPWRTRTSFV